ncbi:PH domain-containing protein [Geodermatophilus sp. YIM 151500]|uniref:PH domain-containing protein n=1 Tax=Geodermatophilus sp. YIM 151500 TaxID=2984531 RepID=UPI0021E4210A|nr:PH domain-containing protein [Geodermatophilus sp. YIM 151500]MCV2491917.1 PH domain-containing protein [Geodermatophilus sp. YIM 151500]
MASPPLPPPVSAVPRRMRLVCAAAATAVVVVMTVVGVLLKESTTGVVAFRTSDQVAMIGLGLFIAAGILALARSRVDADAGGVRILNIAVRHQVPWESVRAVRFDRHSPWASLLLADDDEVSLFAVQAADKERAVRAVEGLRALHAAARAARPAPPPLLHDD